MRVAVTGGSGALGRVIVPLLSSRDHDTTVITRGTRAGALTMLPRVFVEPGDPQKPGPWQQALAKADVVIHLAAPSLFEGTPQQQQPMRTRIMREVVKAIAQAPTPPKVLLVASSLAVYGDRLDLVDERSALGTGALADMFLEMESEAASLRPRTRVIFFRLGHVLSPGGRLLAVTDASALPVPSRVPFSFIHVADAALLALKALVSPSFDGPLNAVATPTTIVALHKALGVAAAPSSSGFSRMFGKTAAPAKAELVLAGQNARSAYAQSLDFYATHATIESAVKACRAAR